MNSRGTRWAAVTGSDPITSSRANFIIFCGRLLRASDGLGGYEVVCIH